MDVVQHYLSEIDLTDVPSELSNLLSEAATTNASDAEVAICVAYNIKQGKSEAVALKSAGVDKATWKKIKANKSVYNAGKKVATGLKNIGSTLVWSGKTSATTHYKNGKKEASKADLVGNNRNRLSVKQASSSAKGSQLVSGTSGEAMGVFEFAVKHLEASGGKLVSDSELKELFNIFQNEMSKAIRNDINVEVGKGKKDFRDWVIADSGRFEQVKTKAKDATDDEIKRHIRAELAVNNAISTADAPKLEGDYIKGVKPLTQKDISKMRAAYISSDMKIGDVTIAKDYLEKANVPSELLTKEALRTQIMDLIDVALKADTWKSRIRQIIQNNTELKKWIVYEAASGLGKFTGKASKGGNYYGDNTAVANKILVFDANGVKKVHDLYKWSQSNGNLCNNVDISFKGSGRRKFIKFGLAAEATEFDVENIINEEYVVFTEQLYILNEGKIWDAIKSGFDSATGWVKTSYEKIEALVLQFYENIIKKFLEYLWDVFQRGLSPVLEKLGFIMEGTCSITTPIW
tara:strand:- start:22887 stop:24443 length:1557 start_codon:yes stop_codon:yes gene_type:complete